MTTPVYVWITRKLSHVRPGLGLACPIYSRINDEHNKPIFIKAYARAWWRFFYKKKHKVSILTIQFLVYIRTADLYLDKYHNLTNYAT